MSQALKELQRLDYLAKLARYPNVPRASITSTTFSDRKANDLTRAIVRWLELHGHHATRVNTQGRYLHDKKKWIPGTTKRGTADIICVVHSHYLAVEVKVGRDKLSAEQERIKHQVEAAQGTFYVARDFQSFYDFYHSLIEKLKRKQNKNPGGYVENI